MKSIGSVRAPPSQQDNRPNYRYPATIQLATQQLKLKGGQMLPLQVGMSLTPTSSCEK